MADSTLLQPPADIPPALEPLSQSYTADDVEADLQAAFLEVFASTLRTAERRINSYGIPHRGDLLTVERFVKAEGLALERNNDREAYMRELYRGWRARNPKRGTAFLEFYLQLLWPGQWTLTQMWHTPSDTYPRGASSTPGAGRILTSRLNLGLDLDDPAEVDSLIASFRAVLAAKFVLTTTVLARFGSGLRMAGVMQSAETQQFNWVATYSAVSVGTTTGSAVAGSSATAVGTRSFAAAGSSAGSALAIGMGASRAQAAAASAGSAIVAGQSTPNRQGVASSAGAATVAGVAPGDPLRASIVLLVPGSGTPGSTAFPDQGPLNLSPSSVGDCAVSNSQPLFGQNVIASPAGSPLVWAPDSRWSLNRTARTLELWAYRTGTSNALMSRRISSTTQGWVWCDDSMRALINGSWSDVYLLSSRPPANTWIHYALVIDNGELRAYRAGSLLASMTGVTSIFDASTVGLYLGQADNGSEARYQGFFANIRITDAVRYSGSTYTVPTGPFPST